MTKTQHGLTLAQFDPQANAYVSSTVHASGADLDALKRRAAGRSSAARSISAAAAAMSATGWRRMSAN